MSKIVNGIIGHKKPTKEMVDWFEERTRRHIELFQRFYRKMVDSHLYDHKRLKSHDESKFQPPEREPYIWTTWKYRCKDTGQTFIPPDGMEDDMHRATLHHVLLNSHHPEYHAPKGKELINRQDRDKPTKDIVDGTKMPDEDIAEMVCDWCAMSAERGGHPRQWAEKNIGVRWKFTERQEKFIFDLIDLLWDKP